VRDSSIQEAGLGCRRRDQLRSSLTDRSGPGTRDKKRSSNPTRFKMMVVVVVVGGQDEAKMAGCHQLLARLLGDVLSFGAGKGRMVSIFTPYRHASGNSKKKRS
jgi:hypothetical protein